MADSIGTAYIQIAPNMSGVQGKIAGQLSGSGSMFAQQFGTEVSAKSAFIIGAIAGVASAATTGAMRLITSSISDAVSRVDTLNAAQKTFQYMGFAADDAKTATKNLTSSILGLPTPLDSAVRGMTSLAATYQDVKLGQKVFSALNDAILGFGGSAAEVDGAVRQLSQLPLDGPLDAMTWNSLRNNGLTPVMVAMSKDMGRSVGQLKEDFGSGKLTVQDFVNELTKMDTKGGGGLVALHKIALNATSGISTGFQNMKTSITRGMAAIIQAVGQKNISQAISSIGAAFETVLVGIAKFFNFINKSGAVMPILIGGFTAFSVAVVATMIASSTAVGVFVASLAAAAVAALPFIAIGAAIGAGAFLISKNWDKIAPVINTVKSAFSDFWKTVKPIRDFIAGQLKSAFTGLVSIGKQLATSFKPLIDALQSILANKTVQTVLKGIGIALLAITAAPIVLFFATVIASITVLSKVLSFLADHFMAVKVILATLFAPVLIPIALAVAAFLLLKATVTTAFSAIAAVWNSVLAPVFNVMLSIVQAIFSVYTKVWAAIALVVVGTMFIVGGVISNVMQTIWGVISSVWNAIFGVISSVLGSIWNVISSVWNGISGFIGGVLNTVGGIIAGAWNWIFGIVSGAVGNIWNSITSVFNNVVGFVGGIGGRIVNAIGNFGGLLYNKGRDLIQGLIDGAGSLLSSIGKFFLEKLPGWIQGPFKKALGISSPSKVFAGYGGNIAEGLINGIKNSAGDVSRAVGGMADSAIAGIGDASMYAKVTANGGIIPSAAYSTLGSGAGKTIVQNNTVNNNVDFQKVINDMTWELDRS